MGERRSSLSLKSRMPKIASMRLSKMPSEGERRQLPRWKLGFVSLNLNLMLKADALVMLRRTLESLRGRSRSIPINRMKTERTMSECRLLLTSCRERLDLTRSRLRKLKRLQLLILQNSDKFKPIFSRVERELTSTNKLLLR